MCRKVWIWGYFEIPGFFDLHNTKVSGTSIYSIFISCTSIKSIFISGFQRQESLIPLWILRKWRERFHKPGKEGKYKIGFSAWWQHFQGSIHPANIPRDPSIQHSEGCAPPGRFSSSSGGWACHPPRSRYRCPGHFHSSINPFNSEGCWFNVEQKSKHL